ncbi:flagellar hook-length control protein FliK [Photobacterium aquae]|uniref:flagellar hook-length control protein FliK n=1 Tax=Photobacterium aquae TaxID=1195763 RepID=UPI00069FA8C2|nr:flagellar hook-length control protein FliK [Photobacterium aquae]
MQVSVSSSPAVPNSAAPASVQAGQGNSDSASSFEQVLREGDNSATQSQPEQQNLQAQADDAAQMAGPDREALIKEWLQGKSQAQGDEADLVAMLAQWLAAQPDPEQALQQLELQAQQGALPKALTGVVAQLGQSLPQGELVASQPLTVGNKPLAFQANSLMAQPSHGMAATSVTEAALIGRQAQPEVTIMPQSLAAAASSVPAQPASHTPQLTESLGQLLAQANGQPMVLAPAAMPTAGAAPTPTAMTATGSEALPQQWQAQVDVSEPDWGRDLVEQLRARMSVSSQDHLQKAHVRLDPPELGRLEVTVRVDGDKASVHFTAAHPQLREALAANADRLRMDFGMSNMDLVDVSVSSGTQQQNQSQQQPSADEELIATNDIVPAMGSIPAYTLGSRFESMV